MTEKTAGNLYVNDYKDPGSKQPDFTGSIEITKPQIMQLIADGKAGKDVKFKLGMWEYPSKKNPEESRFFLVAEAGTVDKSEQGPPPPEPDANDWADDDIPF